MLVDMHRMQVVELIREFIGMGPDVGALRELVGGDILHAPPNVNGARVAEWVLDSALQRATPDRFIAIVHTVDPEGGLAEVHVLVDALESDPAPWRGRLLDEMWVPDSGTPFVDRRQLREVLAEIARGGGAAAIAVDAPTGQGKRTMCDYVKRLAERLGSFQALVLRELRVDTHPAVLDTLTFDLCRALGVARARDVRAPRAGTGRSRAGGAARRRRARSRNSGG